MFFLTDHFYTPSTRKALPPFCLFKLLQPPGRELHPLEKQVARSGQVWQLLLETRALESGCLGAE